MKAIFHKILATTALCLAAMGLSFGCDTISADSGISALLKHKEEILTPVKDYASARKAAELLNALKKAHRIISCLHATHVWQNSRN